MSYEDNIDTLILFTDGSANAQSKIGYGAYLAVTTHKQKMDGFPAMVKVKRFEPTSSTKLELQTLLWALGDIQPLGRKVIIYTDSQNIIGLPGRRMRFEKNEYRTRNKKHLSNYELYQGYYRMTDQLDCEFVKVKGHLVSNQKDDIHKLFTLVDRASRKALREDKGLVIP